MQKPREERLADILLETYGHLGTFEVQLQDASAFEQVAAALEERGCAVTREPTRLILVVDCTHRPSRPEPEAQA